MALYDPGQHRSYIALYGGHDPGVCAKNHEAHVLWALGYPDQGLGSAQQALQLAHQLSHPLSTVIAYCFAAWLHHQRGDRQSAMETAQATVSLATAQGLPVWGEHGSMLVSCFLVEEEHRDADALAEVYRKLQALKLWGWREVYALCLLVEAYDRAGDPARGLELLSDVLERRHLQGFYEPQIYRLKGQLLLKQSSDQAPAAAECFRRAMEIAHACQAKSLELRAATSLAGLLARQGRRDEARPMLADIYGWFTEGFDTRDLKDARMVLEEISA